MASDPGFCVTSFWDLDLTWNTLNPDFTNCFQKTVLTFIPFAIIILAIPFELCAKKRNKWTISWNLYNILLLMSSLIIIILRLAIFINKVIDYSKFDQYDIPLADVISPLVWSLSYITALSLKSYDQKHGIVSSGGLFLFWTASMICELVGYRSLIMHQLYVDNSTDIVDLVCIVAIFPLVCLNFLLNFVPDWPSDDFCKHHTMNAGDRKRLNSYPSKVTFMWMLPLIFKGYSNEINEDDIWTVDEDENAKQLYNNFKKVWNHEKSMTKSSSPISVSKIMFKIYWKIYILGYLLRVCADLVIFLSPFLLSEFISFVENNGPIWKGMLYIICLTFPVVTRMLFIANFFIIARCTGLKIRTTLTAAIYKKGLRLSNSARQNNSVGEMVNLMAVDSQKFIEMLMFLPQFFNAPVTFSLALYMLWNILGPSCLAGLAVLLLLIPINVGSITISKRLQRETMIYSDRRLKLLNEILNGMKVLKLYAWENPFAEEVQDIRSSEIGFLSKNAYLLSLTMALWTCASVLMTIASFAVFVLIDDSNVLTPTIAFVSLTLFNIIRIPLITLPRAVSSFVEILVSLSRLTKFMNEPELDSTAVSLQTSTDDAILVKDANFSWDEEDDESTLKNININVGRGKLVAIVGRVGSGKSSVLSALLGDMRKQQGLVERQGSVAYVPQQAWIQNATVKDNILFYKTYSKLDYNKVIKACALEPDFELFVAGDMTEIGEKGVNLSGGQKQRISLARSVYNDADMYLLDDPLSAVDAHVGKHIFDEVIGPNGLLCEKTRLLSTNSLTYLHQCDHIIVMKEGVISEYGTYKELLAKDGAFSELILQYIKENDYASTDIEVLDEILEESTASEALKRELTRKLSLIHSSEFESVESSIDESFSKMKKSNMKKHKERGRLVATEEMEIGKVKFTVYWSYMKQMGMMVALGCSSFWLIYIGFIVAVNVYLSTWTNDSLDPELTGKKSLLDIRLTVYSILGAFQVISMFCGLFTLSYGALTASKRLHNNMLKNIIRSPMAFFDVTPMGRIMNRFSKDCNILDVTLLNYFMTFLTFTSNLLASLLIIVSQTPIILVVLLPLTVAFYFLQKMYLNISRQLKRIESVSRSPIFSLFSESIAGSSSIRAYDVADVTFREFNKNNDSNHRAFYSTFLVTAWLEVSSGLMTFIVLISVGIFSVFLKDIIGPSAAGLAVSFTLNMTGMFLFAIQGSSDIETNIVSGERILEYTHLKSEAPWENKESKLPASWPDAGEVRFIDYQTRYRPELNLVLKGITCDIKPTEKIGICGRTGAGKSSLTLALFRIIESTGGAITIDGVDIATLGLHELRLRLTIIPQDPVLFTGALRFNLDPFSSYSDSEVLKALELAHLKDYVISQKGGLMSIVTEGGGNMSVGQRQLICLARALLRKTKVLLLDEATAAVDLETDDLIQATIRKEFADCTVITIAHRLNTIMDSSRVMVLSDGIVTEFDSPANLLNDEESTFYSMVKDSSC